MARGRLLSSHLWLPEDVELFGPARAEPQRHPPAVPAPTPPAGTPAHASDVRYSIYLPPRGLVALSVLGNVIPPVR